MSIDLPDQTAENSHEYGTPADPPERGEHENVRIIGHGRTDVDPTAFCPDCGVYTHGSARGLGAVPCRPGERVLGGGDDAE
jgi:hypothetical protein